MADETPKSESVLSASFWTTKTVLTTMFVAMTVISWGIMTYQAVKTGNPLPAVPAIPVIASSQVPDVAPPVTSFGWIRDDNAVKASEDELPIKFFNATPAGADDKPLPAELFQWVDFKKSIGRVPRIKDQNPIGSCVGFGSTNAAERALALGIGIGQPFEFTEFTEEAAYAFSRVEVNGGRSPLRGDGSVGAWAAVAWTKFGGLPRKQYPSVDLRAYDPTRCRSWGSSGVPNELETEAVKFTAGDATKARTWSDVKRALANRYGVYTCSIQGFTMNRDANGICLPSGQWGHCMCLDGYCTINGREYGHFENSWGPNAHRGPVGPGNPSTAGFWADSGTIQGMLNENDSWILSATKGFPKQQLDWFTKRDDRRDDVRPAELLVLLP